MISREQLKKIAAVSGLHLYQQEKDYLLKLFLYNYYRRFDSAIFKGGTCIKYLYGLNRFSEDLDFNLLNSSKRFEAEVEKTLGEISRLGIENSFIKVERFRDAFTCEVAFKGPLFTGSKQTRNKFRIDAGKHTGILIEPEWQLISSEYPETPENFLVRVLNDEELLAEKLHALNSRKKGRDLYDAWFLIKKGVPLNRKLLEKKFNAKEVKGINFPQMEEYERDMAKLSTHYAPYSQAVRDITEFFKNPQKKTQG